MENRIQIGKGTLWPSAVNLALVTQPKLPVPHPSGSAGSAALSAPEQMSLSGRCTVHRLLPAKE